MRLNFYWHTYKYFPYEKLLAQRELRVLLGQEPTPSSEGLSIEASNGWEEAARRMTYFREAAAEDGTRIFPQQAALEASVNGGLRALHLFEEEVSQLSSRQSTRYSAHGLHEYRGKFNPQIVRTIGNMLGLKPGDWVLDPFCGSGTSLLEAAHIGWNAIGVDLNPLGVQIAQAKIASVHVPVMELKTQTDALKERLSKRSEGLTFNQAFSQEQIDLIGGKNWQSRLPSFDYLLAWFTESVLAQLSLILAEIARIPSAEVRLILHVILSDIVREVSLQDPSDLRIRRRKSPPENAPALPLYMDAMTNKIGTVLKARQYLTEITTMQEALRGDSRYLAEVIRQHSRLGTNQRFSAAITSPPYATALPYIDTQRLSLVLLGLIKPAEIIPTEKTLTGNREITPSERQKIEAAMATNADHLPAECLSICLLLKESLDEKQDGFRRQNVPALLYKYLADMRLMFGQTFQLLEAGAPFALVVGQNQTSLGGKVFTIDTPYLLGLLAEQSGFLIQEALKLDTYQRYDVHQANSIRSETLLILKRP